MIIPVRCFTCAKVLADKWEYYVRRCKELEEERSQFKDNKEKQNVDLNEQHYDKNVRETVFKELGLDRICCRRMMLGHVDLIDII